MGLFDNLSVHESHGIPASEYQTKDLDGHCHLYNAHINKHGRLLVEEFDTVPIETMNSAASCASISGGSTPISTAA